jgi:hypothetical protein
MRRRSWVIGALLFIVFAVIFAPATLIRSFLPADGSIDLLQAQGSLWRGSAELFVEGLPAGTLRWNHRPVTILQGSLGYDIEWFGVDHRISGRVKLGPGQWLVQGAGNVDAPFLNRWLAPYDIVMSGRVELDSVSLSAGYRGIGHGAASGSARWDGGPVSYRLAGQDYAGQLPPLTAFLGDGLEAVVYPQDGQTPLLRLAVQDDGFVRIGVTRMLTRLLGNPWPGSQQDHEVVLEVEEQLF